MTIYYVDASFTSIFSAQSKYLENHGFEYINLPQGGHGAVSARWHLYVYPFCFDSWKALLGSHSNDTKSYATCVKKGCRQQCDEAKDAKKSDTG